MYSNIKMHPLGGYSPQQETVVRLPVKEGGFAHHLQSQLMSLDQTMAPLLPAAETLADGDQLGEAISALNDHVQNLQRTLKFSVDETSGRMVITVLDKETQEVIRQIPPEETLVIAKRLEAAVGVFISEAV